MRKTLTATAVMLLIAAASSALCQTPPGTQYPVKPVRMIAVGPGGVVDFSARVLALALSNAFNQQVVVDNRPAGAIPGETVARAQPDGYTLLVAGGSFWVQPLLQERVPYDPSADFIPISLLYGVPYLLVAHPSLPVKSVKELIALAKARPGEINYASAASGSASHLAAALFTYMTAINIVRIPYKAAGARTASLLAGEVQLDFATGGGIMHHMKSGRLKVLAITSAKSSGLFLGVPTIAADVPGYESTTTGAMFARTGTPVEIIHRLSQEVTRALNRTELRDKLMSVGAEAIGSSPEQLVNHMKSEISRMGKLIKATGIREE